MKDIFYYSPYNTHRKYDIFVYSRNTSSFGDKSLRALGPHIWNSVPESIKSTDSISIFKNLAIIFWIMTVFLRNCKINFY